MRRAGALAFPVNQTDQPSPPAALVVDDNPMCRELVARVLREKGFRVALAKDGFQAILALVGGGRSFALLIVDTEMPGVHGWEVIRCARSKARRTRILRLGRREDETPGLEYRSLRRVPVLGKPFTGADLVASLRAHFPWLVTSQNQVRPRRRD